MTKAQIANWLRVNIFRVRRAAEEGSLTAQYIMLKVEELVQNPKNVLAIESLPRYIDMFEREWERRQPLLNKIRHNKLLRILLMMSIVMVAVVMGMIAGKILMSIKN